MRRTKSENKRLHACTLDLTAEQREQIQRFWKHTGSVGTVEILVDVVDNKISPASIQVGTAK